MGERRNAARSKSFLRGSILFNKGRNVFDCLIRDISPQGARIVFSDAVQTPDIVDLYIPQKDQTLRAEVQWRRGDEMGLVFEVPAEAAEPGDVVGARIDRLETEIAALKRMIRRLRAKVEGTDDAA